MVPHRRGCPGHGGRERGSGMIAEPSQTLSPNPQKAPKHDKPLIIIMK